MKVSLNWLKELVKIDIAKEDLAEILNSRIQGGVKEIADNYIELDLKGYNRADLLSLRGVAYEVAAISDSEVNFKETEESELIWNKEKLPETPVKIEALDLVPVYCIAKIEGLKVASSEKNWMEKLAASGMRSINNVADITNLIMLEYGQPTHAFDAAKIKDQTLIVRAANTGEELVTLDHKTRVLEPMDLVIADPEKAVGLAGVMGSKDSEVSDSTTTILLEAAIFDPVSIRRTANRLALPSEASKRFQHGLTKKRLLQALDAAIKMYQGLGGKLTAISIVDHLEEKPKEIEVSYNRLLALIGVNISPEKIKTYLENLHFSARPPLAPQGHPSSRLSKKGTALRVEDLQTWVPPYWRLDIEIEADVIEEVARMYGYENIHANPLAGQLPEKVDQKLFELISSLKNALVETGLDEIQTYSFYSTKIMEALDIYKGSAIKLANPMSKETEYLRALLWPNLAEKVGENLKNYNEVGIFEIGKVYQIVENSPYEAYHLALAFSDNSDNPLASLFSAVTQAFIGYHIPLEVKEGEATDFQKTFSHPTRVAMLESDGGDLGYMSELHPRVGNKLGIEKRVAILEVDLTRIITWKK